MDFLFWALTLGSAGAGAATAAIRQRKITARTIWRPQTKAELFLEQKELSRWLIAEVSGMISTRNASKEDIAAILGQISALYQSAALKSFSNHRIEECLTAAEMARQVLPEIDRKYLYILGKFTENVVAAVLRASGEKEGIFDCQKTMTSLGPIAPVFKHFTAGMDDKEQWKIKSPNGREKLK